MDSLKFVAVEHNRHRVLIAVDNIEMIDFSSQRTCTVRLISGREVIITDHGSADRLRALGGPITEEGNL